MSNNPSREERLAAKLRENLRRRKSQARAMDASDPSSTETSNDAPPHADPDLSKNAGGG